MLAVRVARARVGGSFRLLHWLAGVARSIAALLTTSHGETRQCLTGSAAPQPQRCRRSTGARLTETAH